MEYNWCCRAQLPAIASLFVILMILGSFHLKRDVIRVRKEYADAESQEYTTVEKLLEGHQGEKYMWYSPHSGFGNQMAAFRNALRMAGILNRTLLIPPILHHFDLPYGSCMDNVVASSWFMRAQAWRIILKKMQSASYVSMADVVDISGVERRHVRTIDFRLFVALKCGIDVSNSLLTCGWCQPLLNELQRRIDANFDPNQSADERIARCAALLSATDRKSKPLPRNESVSAFPIAGNCKNTLFTYQKSPKGDLTAQIHLPLRETATCPDGQSLSLMNHGNLEHLLLNKSLNPNPKVNFQAVNVVEKFGLPNSPAFDAEVLSLGSAFTAFDFSAPMGDLRADAITCATEFLPFSPEIVESGMRYAQDKIRTDFACLHFRGGDGFFKGLIKTNLQRAKDVLSKLREEGSGSSWEGKTDLFLMSDLTSPDWERTFQESFPEFNIHFTKAIQEMEKKVLQKVLWNSNGLWSNRVSKDEAEGMVQSWWDESSLTKVDPSSLKEVTVKMYLEQVICSCGTLGFVPHNLSTISSGVQHLRNGGLCGSGTRSVQKIRATVSQR